MGEVTYKEDETMQKEFKHILRVPAAKYALAKVAGTDARHLNLGVVRLERLEGGYCKARATDGRRFLESYWFDTDGVQAPLALSVPAKALWKQRPTSTHPRSPGVVRWDDDGSLELESYKPAKKGEAQAAYSHFPDTASLFPRRMDVVQDEPPAQERYVQIAMDARLLGELLLALADATADARAKGVPETVILSVPTQPDKPVMIHALDEERTSREGQPVASARALQMPVWPGAGWFGQPLQPETADALEEARRADEAAQAAGKEEK